MPEENMQPYVVNEEPSLGTLSNDDLAAALGYITSLMEMGMTPPGEPTDMQEEEPEEPKEDEPKKEDVDSAQSKDIEAIKSEMDAIRAEIAALGEEEGMEEEEEGTIEQENADETGKTEAA